MKKRASMMLDYLIADYAAESLDGIYVAPMRASTTGRGRKMANPSSDFGWVLFGSGLPIDPPDGYIIFYAGQRL